MPRNPYISHGTASEQNLHADLIEEAIKIYGHDVYYLPRNIVELDTILNEDVTSTFDSSYICEMYIESFEGFEGDGKLITKFGLEIRDQLTLVVSSRRWTELVGNLANNQESPNEGDLIYIPLTKSLFEIKYADNKKPFYQLGNLPTYRLTCELFEYSNQDINTGISDIDRIQSYSSQGFGVISVFDDASRFIIGEKLTIELPTGIMGTAELLKSEDTLTLNEQRLFLGPLTWDDGEFHVIPELGTTLENTDGTTSEINYVFNIDDDPDSAVNENDPYGQNSSFEQEGDDFIDFSEENPFGNVIS